MEVTTLLVYLIIAITSILVYLLRRNLGYWKRQGIPHEEPNALVGNMKGVRTTVCIGEIVANYYRKFKGTGPFAGIFIGQRPGVVLLERDVIRQILIKDFAQFTDRGMYYNEKSDPLTGHLFLVDGEKWRSLRNKLSPTFTAGKMKYMYPTVLKVANKFLDVLAEKVKANPVVEVRDLLGRYTTDIIASVAFGIECNSLRNPEDKFSKLGRKSVEQQRHNPIVMNFIDSFPRLSRLLGMRIISEDVHQFFMTTILETVEYREKHKIQRNDFLNILIDLKNNAEGKTGLSLEELAAQVFVFFLGGFETSSSTLTYALYELAQHQELQDRLREEVNEVFQNVKETEFSYDTVKSLPYLDQVISETLRKYPILPLLNRQALNDYVVPGYPKYAIAKGTPIFIPVLGIQHDPEFYPNPEEFDPERFSPENVKQRDAVEWLPFGDGPRNCIGMRFGQMQMRLGLASVVQRFRFTVCSKTPAMPLTFDPKSLALTPRKLVYLNVEAI